MAKVSKDARSRFQAGPIASLEPPDLQLRMDILEAKSARRGLTLPPDVCSLIAGWISTSVRDLESAVEQLHTYAQLTGQAITLPVAQVVLRQLGSLTQQEAIPLNGVLEATARYYGLSVEDLASRKRTKVIAQARQLAMYLAREETETSLPQIGQALGGRDHSTVVHGCARIASLLVSDPALAQDILTIRHMLRDGADAEAKPARPADAASVAERLIRQVTRGL
jgi:chromosomal replication initiator protein